jgi:uncharacterized protein YecE (DUF72 family)
VHIYEVACQPTEPWTRVNNRALSLPRGNRGQSTRPRRGRRIRKQYVNAQEPRHDGRTWVVSPSGVSPGKAYVGCSGWSYNHWRGTVYDSALRPKEWFSDYARRFCTVEVNNTFYRLPEGATFEAWRAQAPEGFVYSLKVNQYGTHRRRLREPETWLPNFVERAILLGPTLGPNLVQLPPRWRRDTDRLGAFLEVATSGSISAAQPQPPLRWAVEFRDPSWLHEDTYQLLRQFKVALCVHDLLPDHPWLLTTNWAYCRFHGPNAIGPSAVSRKYSGAYGPERLAKPASVLSDWQGQGCDVYAYFNNDEDGAAVRDATWLRERLGS